MEPDRFGWAGPTFAEDLLAYAAYPPVLDRSVTSVDVEESVLGKEETASKQHKASERRRHPTGSAWHAAKATSALSRHHLKAPNIVVHWVFVRHFNGRRGFSQPANLVRCRGQKDVARSTEQELHHLCTLEARTLTKKIQEPIRDQIYPWRRSRNFQFRLDAVLKWGMSSSGPGM